MGIAIAVAVAVALVESPRWGAGPAPRECLRGVAAYSQLRVLWAIAAVVAGTGCAVATALLPGHRRRAGVYGRLAAALLAAGWVLGLRAVVEWWLPGLAPEDAVGFWRFGAPGAVAAMLLSVLLAPCLAERGWWSLIWVPLVVFVPLSWVGRLSKLDAAAAHPIALVQRAAEQRPFAFVSLPGDWPVAHAQALAMALRWPFRATDLDFVALEADSSEESWFMRAGFDGLRVTETDVTPRAGVRLSQAVVAGAVQVVAECVERQDGNPGGLWVRAAPVYGRTTISVATPAGVVRMELGAEGRASLEGAALRRFQELVRPLPAGLPIVVLAVSRDRADAYGWLALVTP